MKNLLFICILNAILLCNSNRCFAETNHQENSETVMLIETLEDADAEGSDIDYLAPVNKQHHLPAGTIAPKVHNQT